MITINYSFHTPGGGVYTAGVTIDEITGEAIGDELPAYPAWVALEYQQCPNCPLRPESTPQCPVARRLIPLVDIANSLRSHDAVDVEVLTAERRVIQHTTAQRAMSALLGVVMASAGCPALAYFKPMARYHLPFATEDETIYRVVSMFLLAKYLAGDTLVEGDVARELGEIYGDIQKVNIAIAARLRQASSQDAAMNGLVLLDLFAKGVPYAVPEVLAQLRPLFSVYFPREDA